MQQTLLPYLLSATLFAATPRLAQTAAAASDAAVAPAPQPAATEPASSSFGLPLAAAYAAPVVLFGAGALVDREHREAGHALAYTALAALALPPVVRFAYGAGSDVPSALMGTLGFAGAGTLAGMLIGAAVCDRETDGDCIGTPIQGAAIGLFTGYVAWAIVDSVFLAHPPARTHSASAALQPGVAVTAVLLPLLSESKTCAAPLLTGLSLGASVSF